MACVFGAGGNPGEADVFNTSELERVRRGLIATADNTSESRQKKKRVLLDYLERALTWQGALDRYYANPATGGYFLTANDAEGLVVRPAATTDDATPNPNAVIAQNLVRLAAYSGQHAWRQQADRLLEGLSPAASGNVFGHLALLNALDFRLNAAEIVVAGRGDGARALADAALKLPFINRIVLRAPDADALPASHPARAKLAAITEPAAFVCVGETCSLPVTRTDAIAEAVRALREP